MHCKVFLCAAIMMTLIVFPGCNKKNKFSETKKTAAIPEMSKKTSTDTSDIFKEFYSDDTTGQGSSKKSTSKSASKNHTFSPATPSPAAASSSGEFLENGRYIVQVSCVQSKSFAGKMVNTLKEKNFPAYSAEVQNPTPALSGTFYRVRIGCFASYASAKAFGDNTLVAAGYEFWVDKKANDNTGMEGYGLGSGAGATAAPAINGASPTSSWSTSAPTTFPAAESPSSNPFGQSDFNTSSNASAPVSPNSSSTPLNGSASSNNATPVQPVANSNVTAAPASSTVKPSSPSPSSSSPSPTTKPSGASGGSSSIAPSPSTSSATPTPSSSSSAKSAAPAKETSDWGSDSATSGW
jgi:hypothetical protein